MTQQAPLRILIAENHDWVRFGLALSLEQKSNFQIVGQVEDGELAVEVGIREQPDIALMDIGLPRLNGIEATRKLKAGAPNTRVVMLTSHLDITRVSEALAAGADGYCMKDIQIDRLIQVVEMIAKGAIWLDPEVAHLLPRLISAGHTLRQATAASAVQPAATGSMGIPPMARNAANLLDTLGLTPREAEVLALITQGKSNKEIAQILCISSHTVKIHVSHIIQKLAVEDRTQVAIKAMQEGLVPLNTRGFL